MAALAWWAYRGRFRNVAPGHPTKRGLMDARGGNPRSWIFAGTGFRDLIGQVGDADFSISVRTLGDDRCSDPFRPVRCYRHRSLSASSRRTHTLTIHLADREHSYRYRAVHDPAFRARAVIGTKSGTP